MITMMKSVNEMALGRIRLHIEMLGVKLTDDQFESLTYRELKKIYKKAEKASELRAEINRIVNKPDKKK